MGDPKILDGAVKIALAKIQSDQDAVAIFEESGELIFGLFSGGTGATLSMTPEQALILADKFSEWAVLSHANIAKVRREMNELRDRVQH